MSGTGSLQFRDSSSLGNATINVTDINTILDGAGVTGGTATINTNDDVNLDTNANLQNATVNLTGGGRLRFLGGTATGGQAAVNMLSASSEIRFQNHGGTGTMIGSLAGSGEVFLTGGRSASRSTRSMPPPPAISPR